MLFLEKVTMLQKNKSTMLADGAMGTMLAEAGLSKDSSKIDWQLVRKIHDAYIEAGSECITTNSFSLNSIYTDTHSLDINLAEANRLAVQTALEAAKNAPNEVFVLGDIGPTGVMLAPYGAGQPSYFQESFYQQAGYLAEAGADALIVETMFNLDEALLALAGCKAATKLPVIVSMAFATLAKGGRTIMGNAAADCASRLAEGGAAIIGANCGNLNPHELALLIGEISSVGLPVLVQANAGKPRLLGTKTVYDMEPQEFAAGMMEAANKGATIVGGCCGTGPQHIAALRDALRK